jgi:hypothetical protein
VCILKEFHRFRAVRFSGQRLVDIDVRLKMKPLHLNVRRPTLADAHAARKAGRYPGLLGDYATEEEQSKRLEKTFSELDDLGTKRFPRTQNLEYAVLKTHILMESIIDHFICGLMPKFVDPQELNMTCSKKIDLAYFFGLDDIILFPCVELLNRARNQVAHRPALDESLIREFCRLQAEDYQQTDFTRNEMIRALKMFVACLSGLAAGRISANYQLNQLPNRVGGRF